MASREWTEKDYYKILGVEKGASKADIKKAYRKLAQQFHPDTNKGDPEAERRFKEISEAHSVLGNDEKRTEYDQIRSYVEAGGRPFGFGTNQGGVRINVEDLNDLFGGAGGGGGLFEDLLGGFGFRSRGPRAGADLEAEIEVDFEDAVNGTLVVLENGAKARIPPGVGNGARIKIAGKGESGPNGGPPGDLYVRVRVRPHEIFDYGKNGDLTVRLPVTWPEAVLGTKVQVPTLSEPVTVKVPPGTKNGKTLRVRGKGAPRTHGGHGDLLVKVDVQVPEKVNKKEKDLIEQLAQVHTESPRVHLEKHLRKTTAPKAS